ncbi:MAG: peptide chain release factor N(5)-glutamine methyltransferase [Clostridiales bacterium]|nr:peptide chain release factor N(5)-glutamine methyltransferase [Clostridiales bacterium]
MIWNEWRDKKVSQLKEAGLDDAAAELREIIARISEKRRAIILFEKSDRVEDLFEPEELERIEDTVRRRCEREPMDYILGESFFYRDSFEVGPGVLVPRPESELLVAAALRTLGVDTDFLFGKLEEIPVLDADRNDETVRIFDLCTGTGCIGISISNVLSGYLVSYKTALTERYEEAGEYAQRNIRKAREPNLIRLFRCDLFPEKAELEQWWGKEPADLIVANPPYISEKEIDGLMPEVSTFEPREALSGGPDGLESYRAILDRAGTYLRPNGLIIFEHGYDQKDSLAKLLFEHDYQGVACIRDHGGQDRVSVARYCPKVL